MQESFDSLTASTEGPVDALVVLARRARLFERAVRSAVAPLGGPPLDVVADFTDPLEPSVWIRSEVLASFRVDGIVVGRVAGNMTDVDEVASFPAGAVIDAAKFAVMDALSRLVGREIENAVIAAGSVG